MPYFEVHKVHAKPANPFKKAAAIRFDLWQPEPKDTDVRERLLSWGRVLVSIGPAGFSNRGNTPKLLSQSPAKKTSRRRRPRNS